MRAIVPRHPAETAQPEIRLVHQSGRLERMTGALRPQMPGGDGPELGVNQGQELFERAVIPLLPGAEILGDLVDSLMIQGRRLLHRARPECQHCSLWAVDCPVRSAQEETT